MRRIRFTIAQPMFALTDWTQASRAMGRLLIGLAAFLMTAMMWTERFLTWDKFLQGGQDLELSLVALVVFLCLIILLAQRSQQAVALQLAVSRFLCCVTEITGSARSLILAGHTSIVRNATADELTSGVLSVCSLPLRI